MTTTRRDFLIKSTSAALAVSFLPSCLDTRKNYLFLSASHSDMHKRSTTEIRKSDPYLAIFDSRTSSTELIEAPSYIHSITQNPTNKFEFLCLPKLGNAGCIYDHNDKSVRVFESEPGMLFYGHGSYTKNGKSFYAAQSIDGNIESLFSRSNYKGSVTEYSGKDPKVKSELESFGNDPHDIQFLDNERVVIANGGSGTNISIIDMASRKLEKSYPCELSGVSCRHLIIGKKMIYVLSMVNISNGRYISHLLYPENGKLVPFGNTFFAKDRLQTQLLSGVETNDHIVTTAPRMNAIHVWDKRSKKLIRVEDFEQAAGIALTLDRSKYIVTSAFENDALEYSASSLALQNKKPKFRKHTGRHTLIAAI